VLARARWCRTRVEWQVGDQRHDVAADDRSFAAIVIHPAKRRGKTRQIILL